MDTPTNRPFEAWMDAPVTPEYDEALAYERKTRSMKELLRLAFEARQRSMELHVCKCGHSESLHTLADRDGGATPCEIKECGCQAWIEQPRDWQLEEEQ